MNQNNSKEISSTQISFQEVKIFKQRLRAFFASSCAALLLAFSLHLFLMRNEGTLKGFPDLPADVLLLPAAILFILGLLLILLTKPTLRRLRWTDFFITALVLASFMLGFLQDSPARLLPFLFGFTLLWHSVLVPTRFNWQAALILLALIGFFLGSTMIGHDPVGGRSGALVHSIPMLVLLAISMAASYTLQNSGTTNPLATQNISNYRLLRELGAGGMGKVYAASHAFLCRPTAIKVMDPQKGSDLDSAIARFEKEIRVSATLSHPNTITIFEYGRSDEDTFFYAMELLEGMDLQKLVKRYGPMPVNRVVHILEQICGALHEAHTRGIIHRDIKPSNIFLSRQGGLYDFVKVLDFGMAKELKSKSEEELTQSGELLGTPRYIAPESVSAKDSIDARTDIYLLGAVAYWMLTGKAPFEGDSSIEVIVEHLTQDPMRPSEVSELKIPKEMEDIVLKCLRKNQDERFQSVSELSEALRKVHLGEPWTQAKAKEWWKLHPSPEIAKEIKQQAEQLEEAPTLESLTRRRG